MGGKHTYTRNLKNFLLQPLIQVKLGLYSISLALVFGVTILAVLYINLFKFYDMVLELTDMREEVVNIFSSYLYSLAGWVLILIIAYIALTIVVSVFYTHKLVGPTYAFRRHIKALADKNYNSRVVLRKADAFIEVAEDLNSLAETLEYNYGKDKNP